MLVLTSRLLFLVCHDLVLQARNRATKAIFSREWESWLFSSSPRSRRPHKDPCRAKFGFYLVWSLVTSNSASQFNVILYPSAPPLASFYLHYRSSEFSAEIFMYFLTTPRVGFRLWNKDDIVLASALWGDPEVTRFIDARHRLDATQIEEKLDAELEMQKQHDMQYWPIFLIENGQHIGCCGLRPKDITARIFEFGVHLRKPYWGTGLAAEAGYAAINYAFKHLKARQLFAGHHPENHGSRGLLEKLGFVYIGDELYPPTGLEHPSYMLIQTTSN